jgi:hypothetical protein
MCGDRPPCTQRIAPPDAGAVEPWEEEDAPVPGAPREMLEVRGESCFAFGEREFCFREGEWAGLGEVEEGRGIWLRLRVEVRG